MHQDRQASVTVTHEKYGKRMLVDFKLPKSIQEMSHNHPNCASARTALEYRMWRVVSVYDQYYEIAASNRTTTIPLDNVHYNRPVIYGMD